MLSIFCVLCLVVAMLPPVTASAADGSKAIQLVDSGTAANIGGEQADNIYFGNYFQSNSTTKEPVKWRVLSNSDGKLFLLSDQNLDVKPYNSSSTSITWEKSTIRSWLNGYEASENNSGTDYSSNNFIDAAFSSDEQVAIADTYVYNKNNPSYSTSGGENTTDQIFLLSIEEANNSSYFPNGNDSRKSTNTAYVASYSGMLGAGEADYWWLRSPGEDDDYAAFVDDGGVVYNNGYIVVHTNTAVRPAFHLNLNSVLFTSAAAGGKSASGMDSGLTAVGGYDGNEWKLTLLDSSRNFSVTEETASGKPGDTITLNYTGASTGDNEYISVILADDSGAQYYGRIAKPTTADGQVKITIPASLADGTYTLNVFSEQYNGGENDDTKLTDYASAFEAVTLTVDTTAPTLSNGSATRDSETTATVKFTSDEAGEYYYTVVESGATEPTDIVSGDSANMASGENTITLTNLTAGTKDIYIVAKDAMGNVSQTLQIVIPEFIPTYTISASPAALNFSNKTVGYTEAPDAKTVTITNTGNQEVTVTLPTGTNYTITAGTGFADGTATLAPNGTATFAVQPKTGLAVGSYSEPLTISSNHNTSAEVSLAFTVDPKSLDGAQVQVSGSYIYDGNAKEPSGENVTVTLDGEPLTENTDYTLSYEDNTDAGEATVKVSGKGNYSGTATGSFTINKATPAYTAPDGLTATYGDTLSDVALSGGWTWDTPDASVGNVGSNTFSATYTPTDTANYNTVTENLTVSVSAKDITGAEITLGDSLTYTGQQQTQQIASVTVDGLDVTYTVTGNTGTDAGDYTLTVTGTGNFTGTATKEWSIAKAIYTGTTGVSGTVLANYSGEVTLPAIPAGASYGTLSTTDDLTGMSITGGKLSYTGGTGITKGQEYKITVPVNGGKNYNNYDITVTLTGTIKQPQTVTISGQPDSVVYGDSFTLSASATGTGAVTWSASGCASIDNNGKVTITGTGEFTITAAVAEDDTYTAGTGRITMTAGKKALTITAENKSAYVGDSAPALTYTVTGLVGSDTLTTAPTLSYASTPDMSKAGTVQILASGAEAGENYDIQYVSGTLTVTTRPSSSGGTTTPSGPSTGGSDGWTEIEDEVDETPSGSTVTVDMNGTTEVPAEVFEAVAGKDVTLELDMGGGVKWEINGQDIPTDLDITDLDLGVSLNTSDIPMDVINMVTGEKSTVQLSLAHDGEFGFTMTLTAPVGTENKGLWANLYHYNTTKKQMLFETAAQVDSSGNVALKFTHASEYAIVLDESSHELPFTDTAKGAWYQGAVEYVYRNSIMTGTSATSFEPNAPLSRAMVAQILYNLEGQPTVEGESTFADASGHWAVNAIAWAQQTGVVNGYEDNTFRPNRAVSREELAQMLYNYAKVKGYDLTASGDFTAFPDGSKVSSWAEAAMAWANGNELINGHDDGTLQPGGDSTRAQAASILMSFDLNLAN